MVFRKEKGNEGFHRQFGALRHQLGGHTEDDADEQNGGIGTSDADDDVTPEEQATAATYGATAPDRYTTSDAPYAAPAAPSAPAVSADPSPPAFDIATMTTGTDASVIAHDAVWEGDLRTNGSLHVHGTVKGTLEATENVYIAEEANIDGTVAARNVVVGGLLKGMVHCSGRFEALATGRLLADVHSPSIVIHEGATMRGQFHMEKSPTDDKSTSPYRRANRQR